MSRRASSSPSTNYYELFNGIITPKQLEGLRLLRDAVPAAAVQPDRGSPLGAAEPRRQLASIATRTATPTRRPIWRPMPGPRSTRHRINTPTLRGVYIQRLFGSQRALKTIEDFTEFEQRGAYFDGDDVIAAKKGVNILERGQPGRRHGRVPGDARASRQRPKLDVLGKLDPGKATPAELRGQEIFFGKGQCGICHTAPYYTDNLMHDLKIERFFKPAMINGLMGSRGWTDQDVPAARRQGFSALHARRSSADAGGHGRVFQPGPWHEAIRQREGGPGRVPPSPLAVA